MTTTARPPAPPTGVDPPHPRIRARRIEVKRDEGRRRRQRLLVMLAVLVVAASLAGLTRSPALDVDHITVLGAHHTSVEAVVRASGIHRRDAMTDVDGGRATSRLAALPWVAHVSVRRQWPGTVRITVVERVAVAQVPDGARWALVDQGARVLSVVPAPRRALPTIDGFRAGAVGSVVAGADPALALVAALPASVVPQVSSISLRAGELWLTLHAQGIEVRIGPARQLAAKIDAMSALLASAKRVPRIRTIDVLVPSAPVLTRVGSGAADPALTSDQGGA